MKPKFRVNGGWSPPASMKDMFDRFVESHGATVYAAMNGVMQAVEAWLQSTLASMGKTIGDIGEFVLEEHETPSTELLGGEWARLYRLRWRRDGVDVIVGELPVRVRFEAEDGR